MKEKRVNNAGRAHNKAVSPVIATVLLVAVTIILIAIIFLWARRFIPEAILKNDKAIEQACTDVNFQAELRGSSLSVKNTGNIPISSLSVLKISKFRKEREIVKVDLTKGEAKSVSLDSTTGYESMSIVPMLLGKVNSGKIKEYTCPEDSGKEIEV
ncbi:MAG TPA: archaellin/type IV pilin N-terminal domain-containing protein [Candidatus Nanoarchaeia archaeon]|nr:archaellin/type IV pilin N-terminal domain-containing protein [Candidatus Nanoarchaeia archaeon]